MPGAGPGGAENQKIPAHDFLELGPGDLGADEVGAKPGLDAFFLTRLDGLGGPVHVTGADLKKDDAGRVLVQCLGKILDRSGLHGKGSGDLDPDGRVGKKINPAIGTFGRFRHEEKADGVVLGLPTKETKTKENLLPQQQKKKEDRDKKNKDNTAGRLFEEKDDGDGWT